jgi:hypothetical protein
LGVAVRGDELEEICDQSFHVCCGSLRQPEHPQVADDFGTDLSLARRAATEVERTPDVRSFGSDPLDCLELM